MYKTRPVTQPNTWDYLQVIPNKIQTQQTDLQKHLSVSLSQFLTQVTSQEGEMPLLNTVSTEALAEASRPPSPPASLRGGEALVAAGAGALSPNRPPAAAAQQALPAAAAPCTHACRPGGEKVKHSNNNNNNT